MGPSKKVRLNTRHLPPIEGANPSILIWGLFASHTSANRKLCTIQHKLLLQLVNNHCWLLSCTTFTSRLCVGGMKCAVTWGQEGQGRSVGSFPHQPFLSVPLCLPKARFKCLNFFFHSFINGCMCCGPTVASTPLAQALGPLVEVDEPHSC